MPNGKNLYNSAIPKHLTRLTWYYFLQKQESQSEKQDSNLQPLASKASKHPIVIFPVFILKNLFKLYLSFSSCSFCLDAKRTKKSQSKYRKLLKQHSLSEFRAWSFASHLHSFAHYFWILMFNSANWFGTCIFATPYHKLQVILISSNCHWLRKTFPLMWKQ